MYLVRPGSVLARTAAEMLDRHADAGGTCPACGHVAPCPAFDAARAVADAVEPHHPRHALDPALSA
ncbi:hypothetical protein ABZS66_48830 [Dactylosporangium sp. NPDC005572]|uniref:hypothetical protein n=1 Tax=Dactylosporangium sp. NPDC005572 TaxID=3156889 RepID=UPI0033ABDE79